MAAGGGLSIHIWVQWGKFILRLVYLLCHELTCNLEKRVDLSV